MALVEVALGRGLPAGRRVEGVGLRAGFGAAGGLRDTDAASLALATVGAEAPGIGTVAAEVEADGGAARAPG